MTESNPQKEPSMEEILASIRRIISEDEKPDIKSNGELASSRTSTAETDDILELTEIFEGDATTQPPSTDKEIVGEDEILELTKIVEDEEPASISPELAPYKVKELLESETVASFNHILSDLVAAVDRKQGRGELGDESQSIEAMVKEVLRPMVKEWLDNNLPELTQRLVRKEIERISLVSKRE